MSIVYSYEHNNMSMLISKASLISKVFFCKKIFGNITPAIIIFNKMEVSKKKIYL